MTKDAHAQTRRQIHNKIVIPAQAGTQRPQPLKARTAVGASLQPRQALGSRFRGDDKSWFGRTAAQLRGSADKIAFRAGVTLVLTSRRTPQPAAVGTAALHNKIVIPAPRPARSAAEA